MNEVTLRLLDDLSSALEKDERFVSLKNEETALSNDDEASLLLKEANKRRADYLTLRLQYGEDGEKTVAAKKAFHESKLRLEENPKVDAYRKKYAEADAVYRLLDEILFHEFKGQLSCKERHAAR